MTSYFITHKIINYEFCLSLPLKNTLIFKKCAKLVFYKLIWFRKWSSSGRSHLRYSERSDLIEKTTIAYSDRFGVTKPRQWNAVTAASAAKDFATVSAMVATTYYCKTCLTRHTSWCVIVWNPHWCFFYTFLSLFCHWRTYN